MSIDHIFSVELDDNMFVGRSPLSMLVGGFPCVSPCCLDIANRKSYSLSSGMYMENKSLDNNIIFFLCGGHH